MNGMKIMGLKNQVKGLIAGIILGAALFSGITVLAANYQALTANFPIYIDGEEWETDSPVVTIDGHTYLPLKSLGDALGVKVSWNDELYRVEIEKKPDAIQAVSIQPVEPETLSFPVFIYHNSSEDEPDYSDGLIVPELFVKPSEFEKQIKYLSDNNYTFCTFDDWYDLYDIEKPVFITFDDGYEENYTEIFPILQKYNAKITLFLVTDPDKEKILTLDMIREMSDSGLVKFESHTMTHVNLTQISSDGEKLADELRNSKLKIEEMTGKRVIALAYPHGKYNEKIIEKTKEFYMFGVGAVGEMHSTDYSNFEIRRFNVERSMTIDEFIKIANSRGDY